MQFRQFALRWMCSRKFRLSLPEVFILEPRVFGDERGFFFESYNQQAMANAGITETFVQDNHSCSSRNVLRGLHYQVKHPQGKLVRVADGRNSGCRRGHAPEFSELWALGAVRLSGENKRMLWIPAGFAHGFRVVSEKAHVLYKATDFYAPEHERTLAWNDPDLKINWELDGEPIVSAKDQRGTAFRDAESYD